jgi:site-specific DNA recombinase
MVKKMGTPRNPYLFAGLMKCGCCGNGYTLISKDLLGCAAGRNKGTCNNRLNVRRDTLEAAQREHRGASKRTREGR